MKLGKDIHSILKRNNLTVWLVLLFSIVTVIGSFIFSFSVYKNSQTNLYAITENGILVPLKKLDEKRDKLKQVKANLDYFTSLYYDLDGYTMKEKKERLFWLLGKQPTEVIKDRDKKGYFNTFLSINGLIQHSFIKQDSWKILNIDEPYRISFSVSIVRINGEAKTFYNCDVIASLAEVSRNYPYNPYGLLITGLSENLTKVKRTDVRDDEKINLKENNQND
jgi:hypothetical protein